MGARVMRNKLKILRATHQLTQEQLADKIGITRQTVIAMESDRYLPSLGLAFRLAKLFQVKVEDVFSYDEKGGEDEI